MGDAKLTVSLILNNASFTKQINDVNKQLKEVNSEFKNAASGTKDFDSSLAGLQAKAKSLSSQIDLTKQKMTLYKNQITATKDTLNELTTTYNTNKTTLSTLNAKYDEAVRVYGETSTEAKELKNEIKELEKTQTSLENKIISTNGQLTTLKTGLNNTEAEYKNLTAAAEKTHKEIDNFDANAAKKKWEDLSASLTKTGESLQKAGKGVSDVGKTLTASLTLPLIGVATASTMTAANFDKSMSNVSALSGYTGQAFDELREKALELGAATTKSSQDAADALGYMALAGWDNKQMLEGLEPVLRLSEATNMDLALASDLVTDSMGGLKLTTAELTDYLNKVVAAQNNTNTSAEQLMNAFLNTGATATALGIPLEETAAILGVLANNGTKGEVAGTKLNSILTRMTAQSNIAKKAWAGIGVEVYDANGKFRGLTTVLSETREALSKMTDEESQYFLKQTVGTDNITDFRNMLESTTGAVQEYTATIADSDGVLMKTVATQQDNLWGRLQDLESKIESVAIQIGELLLPYVDSLVEFIGKLTETFMGLDEGTQMFIVKAGMFAAVLGPVLFILGKVISTVGLCMLTFGQLSSVFAGTGAAAGAMGGIITALTGPIGIAIAAAALFALAFATNFGGARDTTMEVMGAISEIIVSIMSAIRFAWETDLMGMRSYITACFEAVSIVVKTILDVIKNIFKAFSAAFKGDWQGCWDAVKAIFVSIWEGIKSFLCTALNGTVDTLISFAAGILNAAYIAFTGIVNGATNAWANFTAWFDKAKEEPGKTILGIGVALYEAGKSIFTSLWEGMKYVWTSVGTWIDEKVQSFKDKLLFVKDSKKEIESSGATAKSIGPQPQAKSLSLEPVSFARDLEVPNASSYINDTITSVGTIAQNRKGTAANTENAINQTLAATQEQNKLLMQLLAAMQQDRITNVEIGIDGKKVAKATAKHMNKELYNVNSINKIS